jgi:hypothetical protein
VKVHRSALKHGISSEDAIQAAEWSLWIEPLDEDGPPHRELRLGFDTGARLLETVVLALENGDEALPRFCERQRRDAFGQRLAQPRC